MASTTATREPLTPRQEILARRRLGIVCAAQRAFAKARKAGTPKMAALREFLAGHPDLSQATLYRWLRAWRTDQKKPRGKRIGLCVLLDGRTERSRRNDRMTAGRLDGIARSLRETIRQRQRELCRFRALEVEVEAAALALRRQLGNRGLVASGKRK